MKLDGLDPRARSALVQCLMARRVAGLAGRDIRGADSRFQEVAVEGVSVLFVEVVENRLLRVYRDQGRLKLFLPHWIIKWRSAPYVSLEELIDVLLW